MDIITKDFPVTPGESTLEHPNGTFEVILSAPTLDRDGEIIDARAFDPLPDHITFDTDHSMTVDSVVGSGVPYYAEDGTLRVKGAYCSDERSQTVRQKVAEGHIRTTSVTFMAAKRSPDEKGVDHVTTAELLNGTFTPVPSNRESVVLTAKAVVAKDEAKAGARNSTSDMGYIQTAHDAMKSLGASCGEKRLTVPDGAKSIVGSLEAQRDRVADAIEDAYPGKWTYLRGVLPTAVVFDAYSMDEPGSATWQQTYVDDGSVVTLTGAPVEVDVMEIVTPDADADREPDEVLKSASDAADPAASAAGFAADDADIVLAMKARLSVTENAAHFAFGS